MPPVKKPNAKKDPGARRVRPAAESPFKIPSVFDDEKAQEQQDGLIANMIGGLEQEEIRLKTLQKVNKHSGEDLVPGEQRTYAEAFEVIDKNRGQILDTCGEEQVLRAVELVKQG